MERMLAVVANSETKAYEALRALKQLDEEDSITVYSAVVIEKSGDGKITEKRLDEEFPVGAVAGTAIGALIGLLGGGPLGMIAGTAVGGVAGGLAGSMGDLYQAEVSADFVDEINNALKPGHFAVIADVDEDWVTPVDTQMEALHVSVMRTPKHSFEAEQRAKQVAALRAEIKKTKIELARASADRKAKLRARMDQLNAQLKAQLDEAKKRSKEIKTETDAKVRALKKKAEKAQAGAKANLNARVKRIQQEFEKSDAKLRHMLANQLRGAAARLEKSKTATAH
jgi:uncharacterized membrane protein